MKKQQPSFEEALNAASLWCDAWDKEELSDEVLADRVGELLETKIGARGFLVISLSRESALMDRIPEPLLIQFHNAGELIVDLTVKNLAMSTAMSLHHKKNKNLDSEVSSKRIKQRCVQLLRVLDSKKVKKILECFLVATKGEGEYVDFLNRWNYNNEQLALIKETIYSVAEK